MAYSNFSLDLPSPLALADRLDRFLEDFDEGRENAPKLELDLAQLTEEEIDQMVDFLRGSLIQILEGNRFDPRQGGYLQLGLLRPGQGNVEFAKKRADEFAHRARKILKEALQNGRLDPAHCEEMKRTIGKVHEEVKNAASKKTHFQTGLAGTVRNFLRYCVGHIHLKAAAELGPAELREQARRKVFAAFSLSLCQRVSAVMVRDLEQEGLSRKGLEELATHLDLFLEAFQDTSFAEPDSEDGEAGPDSGQNASQEALSLFHQLVADLPPAWRSKLKDAQAFERVFRQNLSSRRGIEQADYSSLHSFFLQEIAEKLGADGHYEVSARDERFLLGNDYVSMSPSSKDLAELLNHEFYAGLNAVSPEAVGRWMQKEKAEAPPASPGAPSSDLPSAASRASEILPPAQRPDLLAEPLAALSAEWQPVYLPSAAAHQIRRAKMVLECFHAGNGQYIIGPVLVHALIQSIERCGNNKIASLLLTFLRSITENLSLRAARRDEDQTHQKIVQYSEFISPAVQAVLQDGLEAFLEAWEREMEAGYFLPAAEDPLEELVLEIENLDERLASQLMRENVRISSGAEAEAQLLGLQESIRTELGEGNFGRVQELSGQALALQAQIKEGKTDVRERMERIRGAQAEIGRLRAVLREAEGSISAVRQAADRLAADEEA